MYASTKARIPDQTNYEVFKEDGPKTIFISPGKGVEIFTAPYIFVTLVSYGACSVKSSIYFPPAIKYRKTKIETKIDPNYGPEFISNMVYEAKLDDIGNQKA